jgi:hypothetical protein
MDGRPQVSPSLDEANERWEQIFVRLIALSPASRKTPDGGFVPLTPAEREEQRQLIQGADQHGERFGDLPLELVLLLDEPGQWHGVPVEKLLNEDGAGCFSRDLMNVLRKTLANAE